jgi:hypothetical protein
MRNALIELNNYVAYKAASAVVLLTDSSNISSTAFEYSLKIKMNTIQSEHILEDAFRKTAEKGSHEIAKPSYYHVAREGLLEGPYNFCASIFGLNDKLELRHLGNRCIIKEGKEASSITL